MDADQKSFAHDRGNALVGGVRASEIAEIARNIGPNVI
jgi:hypothetical protein